MALAYRSGEAWNEAGYSNPEFDSLLNRAMSIADAETRKAVMARAEEVIRNDGVIIQPFWRSLYNHNRGDVVGAEKHPAHEFHYYKFGFAA